ncbi:hypothetical protein LEMA_P069420.1 [Plenodomus lingam JN3]|uniref:RNB domain-containing protein n=1 Tax=Leptosphaeria maculans (strain JN3 / isolate v23.1.3 / race Av1-4-5-6-7-8) TaxID=985895 RepID=E4ZJZ9_LEPMJ|nr:hypothetical protein LEMA_P069420.1 [Plenodomus lingam JN3]CBX91434.1 hypothetical protein LEMA_P069420.1 [Plenodomus lingam JN3]
MYPRSIITAGNICLRCQWRILNAPSATNGRNAAPKSLSSLRVARLSARNFHTTAVRFQVTSPTSTSSPTFDPTFATLPPDPPFREQLEQWDRRWGGPSPEIVSAFERFTISDDIQNEFTQLSSGIKSDQHAERNHWEETGETEEDELITIGLFLKPGDVVELSQPGREPVLAVFVQQLDDVSQFFSVNGRWSHSVLAKVAFAITKCIDPTLLQPLLPYLPTAPGQADSKGEMQVPVDIAAPVQAKLERLTEEAEAIYRTNAAKLDTAYNVLADPVRTRMMTLSQIAKRLLSPDDATWRPSAAALLAVRKALNHNEFRFRSDARSHRLTNIFSIRPRNDVKNVETVHEWIREYREYLATHANKTSSSLPAPRQGTGAGNIAAFLTKARRLIATSRKNRDPILGGLGPSKSCMSISDSSSKIGLTWSESFTDADQQIINFLQAWVLTGQFMGMTSLHAACASLVQATNCYGLDALKNIGSRQQSAGEINRGTGLTFLQEIGVLSPYENRALYDELLMLPTVRLSRNLELLTTKAELLRRSPDFRDSMAGLRRDWGSATVYCIDDVGAHEIDDGVSIERIEGKPAEYWIHVHVANPTAFFDKTHTLSGLAAHMTESVYTPERFYPMIPSWATQNYFSLDRDRPVITFSSRINSSGAVTETKIQHGFIRNIVTITPSEVAALLGEQTIDETNRLVVGGMLPDQAAQRDVPQLSPDQLQDLKDLYTAAKARWEIRKAAGAIRFGSVSPSVRLRENKVDSGLTWNSPSMERARIITGDPIIELTSVQPRGFLQTDIDAKDIVEEMMLLACHTAAMWCAERNIPVMYRGTIKISTNNGQNPEQIKQIVSEHLEQGREVPLDLAMQYTRSLGRAIAHTAPLPHKAIGVPSYVKVTSPLRRFTDMITHWQIEAAIRHEARTGRKFNNLEHPPTLPLSQRQMQESIITLSPRERIIATTKRQSLSYWSSVAFMRAFNYGEGELPESFKFWVRDVPNAATVNSQDGAVGQLAEYGLKAFMLHGTDVQVGDEWEVDLDSVDVFSRQIFVTPIRLLTRLDASP